MIQQFWRLWSRIIWQSQLKFACGQHAGGMNAQRSLCQLDSQIYVCGCLERDLARSRLTMKSKYWSEWSQCPYRGQILHFVKHFSDIFFKTKLLEKAKGLLLLFFHVTKHKQYNMMWWMWWSYLTWTFISEWDNYTFTCHKKYFFAIAGPTILFFNQF